MIIGSLSHGTKEASYTTALHKYKDQYFSFDPLSCSNQGTATPNGCAVIIRIHTVNEIVQFVNSLVFSLNLKEAVYELVLVQIKPTAPALFDIGPHTPKETSTLIKQLPQGKLTNTAYAHVHSEQHDPCKPSKSRSSYFLDQAHKQNAWSHSDQVRKSSDKILLQKQKKKNMNKNTEKGKQLYKIQMKERKKHEKEKRFMYQIPKTGKGNLPLRRNQKFKKSRRLEKHNIYQIHTIDKRNLPLRSNQKFETSRRLEKLSIYHIHTTDKGNLPLRRNQKFRNKQKARETEYLSHPHNRQRKSATQKKPEISKQAEG